MRFARASAGGSSPRAPATKQRQMPDDVPFFPGLVFPWPGLSLDPCSAQLTPSGESPAGLLVSTTLDVILAGRRPFRIGGCQFSEFVMAPRANWKGFLRLSLVTCPVALFPATSESEKVSFNQINKNTGHRIKYARVDAETGEEVANEDIVKGYKVDTDTYVEVTKDELDNIALESTRTIDIDEFVKREEIDPRYIIRPLLSDAGRQDRARRLRGDAPRSLTTIQV